MDRYWDAVFQGEPAGSDLGALDPDLVATVRRVHALNVAPTADPAFGSRLWEDLMRAHGVVGELHPISDAAASGRAVGSPGRSVPLPFGVPRTRRRWGFAQLAAAAVLLLILGLVYLALGPGRADDGPPDTIPGAVVSATPAPPTATPDLAVTEETLLEVEIPAAVLPPGVAGAAFDYNTLAPGLQTTWTVRQNVHLRYVLSGILTVRSDNSVRVWRGGNRVWEEVAAGTEVELAPGDAVLLLDAATVEFANLGTVPVEIVGMILAEGTGSANPTPPQWVTGAYDLSGAGGVSLPGGPALLRLRRFTLAADATSPAPPAALLHLGVAGPANPAGTPTPAWVVKQPDGSFDNFFGGEAVVYVVTLEATGATAGSPAAGSPTPP
jgi:hypothetical protein